MYHHKAADQRVAVFSNQPNNGRFKRIPCISGEANEDYSSRIFPTDEYKPTKVLVLSQEDAPFSGGLLDQGAIDRMVSEFTDCNNVIAGVPERPDHSEVAAFVSEELR